MTMDSTEDKKNALSPIFVTEPSSGMTEVLQPYTKVFVAVSIMQFPSLWYTGLPSSTERASKAVQ